MSTPQRASTFTPRGPLGRAAYSLAGYAAIVVAICFAVFAIVLIAATAGYVLNQWVGSFFALGGAMVVLAIALYVGGYRLSVSERRTAEQEPEASEAAEMEAASSPVEEPRGPVQSGPEIAKASQLLPVAALVLGAASVLGPRRMLRIGIRLYTMWSTTRSILEQNSPSARRP